MTLAPRLPLRTLAAAMLFTTAAYAHAQSKGPVTQFWMDVATNSMSIPGMDDMPDGAMGGMAGMMGGMFGATKMPGGAPGKWLDEALYTRSKPAGTEGSHAIPPTLNMGPSLPLIPVTAIRTSGGHSESGEYEKPKGRLLFYWGCSETVRTGQPRIVDFSKSNPEDFAKFMTGRWVADRGAKNSPGRAVWPNERDNKRVPKESSLQGDHAVTGEGVPVALRFAIGAAQDFIPPAKLSTAGDPKGSITVAWSSVDNAQAYFLNAMGSGGEGGTDMIIWSSSEPPEPGWGLMDYLPPAKIKQFLGEKVILPTSTQRCAIPQGIFASAQGAMVRMIAYGPELNLSHPPKPAKADANWSPEWAVRVRVKSTGMAMLGMDEEHGGRSSRGSRGGRDGEGGESGGNPLNLLKGIFGR